MLVVTRRRGERFVINGNVTVEVVRILRGKVTLGIVAPKEVSIVREENLPGKGCKS